MTESELGQQQRPRKPVAMRVKAHKFLFFPTRFSNEPGDPESGQYYRDGKLEFGNSADDIYEIRFELSPGAVQKGWRFQTNDPIWIAKGTQCPQSNLGHCDFRVIDKGDDFVTIHNDNQEAAEIHYQLNFVHEDGQKRELDPVILNGGGGKPLLS